MKLLKAVVFSISSVLAATSAFAAPPEHKHQVTQQHKAPSKFEQHKPNSHKAPAKFEQHKPNMPKQHVVKKGEQPKRDWKSGSKVPAQFQAKHYKIDHKQSKKLTPPKANQTWIKVNGDYVLMDSKTYKVIKVVR